VVRDRAAERRGAPGRRGSARTSSGVYFGQDDTWPSPATASIGRVDAKMGRNFRSLGKAAKSAGFRGVSIDVEYPYPRYELEHPVYTYDGYTPGDLLDAAYRQGRVSMANLLDEFPDAVIMCLAGNAPHASDRKPVHGRAHRPRWRSATAPGGFHLATEYALQPVGPR